ncbi:MAG: hypothetical protein KDB27_02005 [Planctomycetales bacterium]|nr:hypothetical protein [Planctomycetales bacterium]
MSAPTLSDRVRFSCPLCSHTVSAPETHIGKKGRCPNCKHIVRIPEPDPPVIKHTSSIADRQRRARRLALLTTTISWATSFALTMLCVLLVWRIIARLYYDPRLLHRLLVELVAWAVVLSPVFIPMAYFLLSVHKIRATRNILYYGFWLGLPSTLVLYITFGGYLNSGLFGLVAAFILSALPALPWIGLAHFPARWLTPYLLVLCFHKFRCPRCHETYEFRDRWSCSCGYTDHRDNRHLLLFSCPKCQNHIGYTECPRCEATILV